MRADAGRRHDPDRRRGRDHSSLAERRVLDCRQGVRLLALVCAFLLLHSRLTVVFPLALCAQGHSGPVRSLVAVPGVGFLSCSNDCTVRLWDASVTAIQVRLRSGCLSRC